MWKLISEKNLGCAELLRIANDKSWRLVNSVRDVEVAVPYIETIRNDYQNSMIFCNPCFNIWKLISEKNLGCAELLRIAKMKSWRLVNSVRDVEDAVPYIETIRNDYPKSMIYCNPCFNMWKLISENKYGVCWIAMDFKNEIMTPRKLGAGRRGRRPLHRNNSKLLITTYLHL